MPAATTELVSRREAGIKKAVAALGAEAEPVKRRQLKKRLRRTQRKRRRLAARDERLKAKPVEAKPAE